MLLNPSFVWGILGVLLIASEMIIPGFTIFFFGAGALLTALVAAILPPVAHTFWLQIIIWAASSVISFLFLRRKFRKIFRGTILDRLPEENVGETALVIESISPDNPGRVRYRGTSWNAVSLDESFVPGDTVTILETSGLTLTVSKAIDKAEPGDDFLDRLESD